MRIFVLLTDLFDTYGGIQTFSRALCKSLSDIAESNNYFVDLYVLNDSKKSAEIDNSRDKYLNKQFVNYNFFNRNKIMFVINLLKDVSDADVVIFGHVNILPITLGLMLFRKKFKQYLFIYGIEVWKKLNPLYKYCLEKMDKIISGSDFTKQQIIKFNNIRDSKIVLCAYTLDPFYENQSANNLASVELPSGRIILTVSRLESSEKYKNIDTVIKALPNILSKTTDVYYVIVGDGNDRQRLEKIAESLGIREHVIFAGKVNAQNLSRYFQRADVFVFPSTGEGFGIVLLEAIFYNKPCICADSSALPEIVTHDESGLLFEPNNSESLAGLILYVLQNKDYSNRLSANARIKFNEKYTFESFKNRIENLMREVDLKLNLGCGTTTPDGWINVDCSPGIFLARFPGHKPIKKLLYKMHIISDNAYNAEWSPRVVYCNLIKDFPKLKFASCNIIYSSHFLEHIPKESAFKLLKRSHSVLKSKGVLRLALPDLYAEAKEYITQVEFAIQNNQEECLANEKFIQHMVSRQKRHAHMWMYDFFSIATLLKQSGFVEIEQKDFCDSIIKNIELIENRKDSLFVECRKP